MQLKELYENIIGNITEEGNFTFSSKALLAADNLMEDYFEEMMGNPRFEIQSAVCSPPEGSRLAVRGVQLSGQVEVQAVFYRQFSAFYMELNLSFLETAEIDFLPGRPMRAGSGLKKYRFRIDEKENASVIRSGVLSDDLSYTQLLSLILEGLTQRCGNLSGAPMLHGLRLTVENIFQAGINKTRVTAQSDAVLHLTDRLEAGKLCICVVRSDTVYQLTLKGEIQFCQKSLPIVLYEQEDGFTFGICADSDDVGELSLNDLLQFVDAPFAQSIPSWFSVLTDIRLRRLLFFLDPGPGALKAAEIEIASPGEWKFLGIDGFVLKEISISFSLEFLEGNTCTAQISGILSIQSFEVELCGIKDRDGFTFRGEMPRTSEWNLKSVAELFAGGFGIASVSLPIPDIFLKFVFVSFSTSETSGKPFQLSAFVDVRQDNEEDRQDIAKKLLNIQAKIQIESVLSGGTRTYSGSLEGCLEISGQTFSVSYTFGRADGSRITAGWKSETDELTLVSLLEEFHVAEIPEILRSISIGLTEASVSYDLVKKQLNLELADRQHGRFTAYIWKDAQGRFQYAMQVGCVQPVELSNLPVVGKDFRLLDSVRITGISLSAASAAYGAGKGKAGVCLQGSLEAGGSAYPFALEIEKAEEKKHVYLQDDLNDVNHENHRNDKNDKNDEKSAGLSKWFDIHKNLGVFSLRRIAVTYQKGAAGFLLDASLAASPIGIDLLGVGLGFELSDPSHVHFFLSGLGISYTSQAVAIKGTFAANADKSYDGELLVKAAGFSLSAVGSYQEKSLFAYALLCGQIGGPPAFYVTGIAGGFGYNRSLKLPQVEDVGRFPMVRAAYGRLDKGSMISELKSYIQVSPGTNFLAAGIKFQSFKMADSFALCTVSFGNRLEIALLGLSEISVPARVQKAPIAYAQLALKAVCVPEEGVVSVMAELTKESYILSKACRLTGGFAFCLWFDGGHKGDFVITLGGYHPAYQKPGHYPSVPRLGFQWCVTPELTLGGELYFALTPRCLMAGGALNAVYQSGNLRAWFCARADFFIGWKPFYYEASLYIGLGASYRLNLLFCHVTVSAELSADLHIWGPDFSGEAKITWFILSFTIRFGESRPQKTFIGWDEFEESFLGSGGKSVGGLVGGDVQKRRVHAVSYADGLLWQSETDEAFVDPETLKICIRSQVPMTELWVNGREQKLTQAELGVLPMGEHKKLHSPCRVRVTDSGGSEQDLAAECLRENVPSALWGMTDTGLNGTAQVPQICVGVCLSPPVRQAYKTLPADGWLNTEDLSTQIQRSFSWNRPLPITGPDYPQKDTIGEFAKTVESAEVKPEREKLLAQWQEAGFHFDLAEVSLTKLAQQSQDLFMEDICLQAFRNCKQTLHTEQQGYK